MKTKLAFAVAALLAGAALFLPVSAEARTIGNRIDADGVLVLVPAPRELTMRHGALKLGATLELSAPAAAENEAGVLVELLKRRFPEIAVRRVPHAGPGGVRLELSELEVPKSPEGYSLDIGSAGIDLRARDVRGLYYGVQTLGNLLRNAAKPELPHLAIYDFPALAVRGSYFEMNDYSPDRVPELLHGIEVMGSLKYNAMAMAFEDNFPYKDNPFTARKLRTLSREQFEAIRAAARRHHIEIIPSLQVITHDKWLRSHPKYWTDIAEDPKRKDWSSASCPLKPLPKELYCKAIREQIEFFQPKAMVIHLDEISLCPWGVCELCRKHGKYELWRDVTLFYTKEVLKYGVTPLVAYDQYYPYNLNKIKGYRMLPDLDRRIVFGNWDYRPRVGNARFDYFRQQGFPVAGSSYCLALNNTRNMPRKLVEYGLDRCTATYWGSFKGFYDPKRGAPEGWAGVVTAGAWQWNPETPAAEKLPFDPAWELWRRSFPVFAPTAAFAAADELAASRPLAIGSVFNARIGKDDEFPLFDLAVAAKLRAELLRTPERFALSADMDGMVHAAVARPGAAAVEVPVDAKVRLLSFLVTGGLTVDPPYRLSQPHYGDIEIVYADGGSEKVPLQYRRNLNHWASDVSGCGIRFVNRFNDRDGALASLYAIDWRNPKPERPVAAVRVSMKKEARLPLALFAVSAAADELPPRQPIAFVPSKPLPEYAGAFRRIAPGVEGVVGLCDLSQGIPESIRLVTPGSFTATPKMSVAVDPLDPARGKVLRIDVPACDPKRPKDRGRIAVDFFIDRGKVKGELRSLCFDCRVENPEFVDRPACYLGTANEKGTYVLLNYLGIGGRFDDRWHHIQISADAMEHEGRKPTPNEVDKVRVSFFLAEHFHPTTIWIGGVGATGEKALPRAPRHYEVVGR